jgi:hypothetical protein
MRATNVTNSEVLQSPVPSMITPFEMFILQLERQRRLSDRAASIWLAGIGDNTLTHDDILTLVTTHFGSYFDALERFMCAVEREPQFADALYHTARMVLKVGFIDEGRALFDRIEPLMESSVERTTYRRDLAALRDENVSAEVSSLPSISAQAKRSTKLKVLN